MARPSRLLESGSMTTALGVYVPAIVFQKAIGLGRVWVFAYMMMRVRAEYGLWAVGMMIFLLAGGVMSLGSNHGLIRYVSYYEARGQLAAFFRRMRWCIPAVVAATAAIALAGSGLITTHVIASRANLADAGLRAQRLVCLAALANAGALALYHSMLAFMVGMRTYRLVATVEVLFGVVFTALGCAALMVSRTAQAVLLAHLAATVIVLGVGLVLLHRAVARAQREHAPASPPPRAGDEGALAGAFARVLRFGAGAMVAGVLWLAAQYVGFHMTNRRFGHEAAAVFALMFQCSQPVLFVAAAARQVVYSHVASRWESGDRTAALFTLETAYRALALATMTLSVGLYALSPLWIRLLPSQYHQGLPLLGGLFLLFQAVAQLSVLEMVAKLHERPLALALAAVAAGAVAAGLGALWSSWGSEGMAWASGAGMCVGGGLVAAAYLLTSRSGLHASTYLLLAAPALLALPVWLLAPLWAAVLLVAVATPLIFSSQQKQMILTSTKRLLAPHLPSH